MKSTAPTAPLFFAANPGGAAALAPVWQRFPDSAFFVTDSARRAISASLTPTERIALHIVPDTTDSATLNHLLNQHAPDILVTGTSIPTSPGGQLENDVRRLARTRGIASICVIDHWCNYRLRFGHADQLDLATVPDFICVMDARAEQEMLDAGFPADRMVVTGQPAFDEIAHTIAPQLPAMRDRVRADLRVAHHANVCVFISEPIRADHGAVRGYDEWTAASDCARVCSQLPTSWSFGIKPHPREPKNKFASVTQSLTLDTLTPHEVIALADVVVGMTSILLLQAALLDRTALSYQPGVTPDSPWAQLIQPLPVLTTPTALHAALCDPHRHNSSQKFYTEAHATDNVVRVILQGPNRTSRSAQSSTE